MPTIGTHRRPASPVPPPLPVGSTATMTAGGSTLPHQMNQAKFAAIQDARAKFCCVAPAGTSTPAAGSTDWH